VAVSLPKVRTSALTLLARSKLAFLKTIHATRLSLPTMLVIMLVTLPVWDQIFLNPIVVR